MTDLKKLTHADIHDWADSRKGPVALHLRETLEPVEGGEHRVIFPPTFATKDKSPYNIDTLADGTQVVLIDSVGAQANRIEPVFHEDEDIRTLVPQVTIEYGTDSDGNPKSVSLMEVGHRLGDAVVRSSGPRSDGGNFDLSAEAKAAFESFLDTGNAEPIARLAPTSLVFGVWDSRDTEAKLPRLVQSTIRAWDVSPLTRSAQYNPALKYAKLNVFSDTEIEQAEGNTNKPLAERGFVDVPATGLHGGVAVHGEIIRDVTINLIALRRLKGPEGELLRRYILGLSLVAATAPFDGFLRQGCLLVRKEGEQPDWLSVERDGTRTALALDEALALDYARKAKAEFGVGEDRHALFDKKRASEDRDKAKSKGKSKSKDKD